MIQFSYLSIYVATTECLKEKAEIIAKQGRAVLMSYSVSEQRATLIQGGANMEFKDWCVFRSGSITNGLIFCCGNIVI